MTTALAPTTLHLGTLWTANLLCAICRIDEPNPDEEEN